jgi:hypothetical protein
MAPLQSTADLVSLEIPLNQQPRLVSDAQFAIALGAAGRLLHGSNHANAQSLATEHRAQKGERAEGHDGALEFRSQLLPLMTHYRAMPSATTRDPVLVIGV